VKIPGHYHTERPAAYVYLNDSGPVIFKHTGLPYKDVTRAPTKAGGFRLYRSVKEVHAVENTSNLPSDFLRVEFKTEPVNENSLRGKFYREEYPAGENFRKVQFENEMVRITRIVIAPKKAIDPLAGGADPALVISLTPSRLKIAGKNSALEAGKTRFMKAGDGSAYENSGSSPAEVLLFEFKTKPFNDPKDRTGSGTSPGHKH
jgi:hypothetical protein